MARKGNLIARHPARRCPSRLSSLSAALASTGSLLALPAWAQTAPAEEATTQLQEVRVSAERSRSFTSKTVQVGAFRDQDPLDVPLTNNVVTREVLDAQGSRSLYGALRNTAGVTRSQLTGSTYDNISVRGILVDNQRNYRLNGSLPIINLLDTPLENKERVEVLKGSSSMYYGLVPPSGIVNFVTKRAGNTPVTSIATSVNNHGGVDAHVDIARRFGADDAMGLRVNAAAGKEEVGIDHFEGDRKLLALAYDWRVSPAINFKADVEHYRKDVSEQAALSLYARSDTARRAPLVPPLTSNRNNLAGEWQRYDAEATNVLLRTDISLPDDWLLTLETGRAVAKRDRHYSNFGFSTPADVATGNGTLDISFSRGQRFENTNHRAELLGRVVTGSVSHELTVGVTANKREGLLGEAASASVPQNYYNPVTIAPTAPGAWRASGTSDTSDKGVYVMDRMAFGERWQLLAGLRYSDYRNTSTSGGTTQVYEVSDTSPNISLLYKPTPDISVYASYLEGLEDTGVAPLNRANAGEVLPPAVNKQKELGVKARVLPSVLVQAALFDIRRPQTTIDAANRFVVGGRSEYRGLELSASGEFGRNWAVLASALLMDAEISRVGAANALELGKIPENTARRTFSLFGEYRVSALPGLALNAGLYHVGKRAVNNLNQASVGGYTTLSLGSRYATKWNGTPVTLQANLDNATDKQYWATTGNTLLGPGLPRTLRLAAKFDF
jgi:iron complex outermembrane receptor protein